MILALDVRQLGCCCSAGARACVREVVGNAYTVMSDEKDDTHTAPRTVLMMARAKIVTTTMGALPVHRDADDQRGSPAKEALW